MSPCFLTGQVCDMEDGSVKLCEVRLHIACLFVASNKEKLGRVVLYICIINKYSLYSKKTPKGTAQNKLFS